MGRLMINKKKATNFYEIERACATNKYFYIECNNFISITTQTTHTLSE